MAKLHENLNEARHIAQIFIKSVYKKMQLQLNCGNYNKIQMLNSFIILL